MKTDINSDPEWTSFDDELLRELRARAQRHDSPVDLPGAERSGRHQRPLMLAAASLLVVAIVIAGFSLWRVGSSPKDAGAAVGALESEPTNESVRVAAALGNSPFAEEFGIETAGLRQVADTPTHDVFVAPAADSTICVVYTRSGSALQTLCAPSERLGREPILVEVTESDETKPFAVVGVAADGYDIAIFQGKEVPISSNGLILTGLTGPGLMTISGPGLPTLRAPVGNPRDEG